MAAVASSPGPRSPGNPGPSLPAWRWAALLGFALVAPVALPAGGAERRAPELRRRFSGEPLLSESRAPLKVAPSRCAPVLACVMQDQPLRVLRRWQGRQGERWLMVETAGAATSADRRRGWLLQESSG